MRSRLLRSSLPLLAALLLPLPSGAATVEERVAQYGPAARARLRPYFEAHQIAYPPARVVLVGLKVERRLELYAGNEHGRLRYLRSYPVLGSSGLVGPKLRQGDSQVPEGLYRIDALQPDSRFHLALHIDYPNAHDRARARQDGREALGGAIMIHGGDDSIGCLAIGDRAAEDLFVLAAETGLPNIRVILSPLDFRRARLPSFIAPVRPWVPALYREIRSALAELP